MFLIGALHLFIFHSFYFLMKFSRIYVAEKDWDDIKFGVDNGVDFYAVSFVKDAAVVHELKDYLKSKGSCRV